MTKIMTFIDGSWLYANMLSLAGPRAINDLHIDYGLLPTVLARRVTEELRLQAPDIVRTYFFASYPVNYNQLDDGIVQRRIDFYDMLRQEFHYETELYPVNFRGRRLRKADRDPEDDFEPKEKSVDIALASSLVFYGSVANAYDIVLVVIGDRDYIPALQTARRIGKRVAIASIRGTCASEYSDPRDQARVKDVDIIWLNDIVDEIELRYEERAIECKSDLHVGDRMVLTTYRPRRHEMYFCDDCRARFATSRATFEQSLSVDDADDRVDDSASGDDEFPAYAVPRRGKIYDIKTDRLTNRTYGFLRGASDKEYYFNAMTLRGIAWCEIALGMEVEFEIAREPSNGRAGAASVVRPVNQAD